MRATDTEARIAQFVAKYTPEIAAAVKACRNKLQGLFPRGVELVYDNYNALVFGFGPSEKASEAVLSIAAYPRWVTLFFLHGATLYDPARLLQGTGHQLRSLTLAAPADLHRAEIRNLMTQALAPIAAEIAAAPPRRTVVKSVSAKQRPRRSRQMAASKTRVDRKFKRSSAK